MPFYRPRHQHSDKTLMFNTNYQFNFVKLIGVKRLKLQAAVFFPHYLLFCSFTLLCLFSFAARHCLRRRACQMWCFLSCQLYLSRFIFENSIKYHRSMQNTKTIDYLFTTAIKLKLKTPS